MSKRLIIKEITEINIETLSRKAQFERDILEVSFEDFKKNKVHLLLASLEFDDVTIMHNERFPTDIFNKTNFRTKTYTINTEDKYRDKNTLLMLSKICPDKAGMLRRFALTNKNYWECL